MAGASLEKDLHPERSVWIHRHGRAVSGGRRPVVDPLLANAVGSVDEFAARPLPVLDNNDDPGVELPLGVIDVR